MSKIVKYNNNMNLVQFNKFKDKELDLFFSICYKMKERGTDEISLDFSELKILSKHTRKDRMIKDLESTYDKLIALNFKIKKSEISFVKFVLFTKYEVVGEEELVKIAVNKEFKHILNELGTTYTKFELEQFVSLKSTYSKNLYKILKQWETLKEKEFTIEDFREILNVPVSYEMRDINKRILNVAMKELNPYFSNLELEKIKVGRKIKKLKFSWATKNMKQVKLIEVEIVISEKLNKTIEKARKNKFINPILIKENIKKMLEIFDEKILINAFNKAYIEIKKEINFNYLKTYIENTLKQQEIKFTVVNDIEDIETIEEKKKELKTEIREPKEKIKITEEEKEQKYKEYLEKHNLEDNKFNNKSFEVSFNNDFEVVEDEEPQSKEPNEKGTSKEYVEINADLREDKAGRFFSGSFESYDEMEEYKKGWEKDNPKRMEGYKKRAEERKVDKIEREKHLKKLKSIELELIMSSDNRLEVFKTNTIQFFQLHDLIIDSYKYLTSGQIKNTNIKLEELNKYFDQFEFVEESDEMDYSELEEEKLLSKNGKKLFGGALISRLKKIAKEMKIKIKYKDQII